MINYYKLYTFKIRLTNLFKTSDQYGKKGVEESQK